MPRSRVWAWSASICVLSVAAFGQVVADVAVTSPRSAGEVIAAGDLAELERRIEAGETTAEATLVAAARSDSAQGVELLLGLGASPEGLQASRALFAARRLGNTSAESALVAAGAGLEGSDAIGRTLLIHLVEKKNVERIKEALEAGVEIDRGTHTGMTALMTAVEMGERKKAGVLLRAGADPDVRDRDGWTALSWAVRRSDLDGVRLLLSRGADPRREDRLGWTPLHMASAVGDHEIVHELLAAGALPNYETASAGTPLVQAVRSGDLDTVRQLLAFGAGRWTRVAGRNSIGWARTLGHREIAAILRAGRDGS